ncbi:MAG: carboxypeptidase-like regulatory domain-containing protein [Lewinellaceae bacterium]|nr:carboxypeptidase-like regulatory domain-containing protein [Lewinellaceae bacterium]
MYRVIFSFMVTIFVVTQMNGQADRTLSGFVSDTEGLGLAYVSIGIPGTTAGTVSAADGSFKLYLPTSVTPRDSLRFSLVGHESLSLPLQTWWETTGDSVRVMLSSRTQTLREVVVRPDLIQKKRTGTRFKHTKTTTNFAISGKPNQNLGAEIGRRFDLPKGRVMLDTFRFFVAANNFDTVGLRINVYNLHKGRPMENLLSESVVVELTNGQKSWTSVDLRSYKIEVNEDVAVSVEWIYHAGKGDALSLPIDMPVDGIHFYKYGSQGRWKRFVGMSTAMVLDVRY